MSNSSKHVRGVSRAKKAAVLSGGALVAASPFVASGHADAAAFQVTNLDDSGAGSLRAALEAANANPDVDTITFQAGVTGTIELASRLEVFESVTVTGPGAASVTIDGNGAGVVFYVYHNGGANIDVTISGLTLTGGASAYGGGIVNWGENLTVDHAVITGNTSTGHGGGIYSTEYSTDRGVPNLTVIDSTISGNTASSLGGGIYHGRRVGTLVISDSTISGNTASGGGGIYLNRPTDLAPAVDVSITGSTISGNTVTGNGGGLKIGSPDGVVEIVDTTISGNAAGNGGGIWFYDTDLEGSFAMRSSTVSGNTAQTMGGGIYLYGLDTPTFIVNSTIANNTSYVGGGIAVRNAVPAAINISHTTISGNSTGFKGGGVFVDRGAPNVHITSSIIGPNTGSSDGDNLWSESDAMDVNYSLVAALDGYTIGGANNLVDVDPLLGALADNGGPTETMKPLAGSPAIDAGDPAFAAPPSTDQRGGARVFNGRIDMGSVEVGSELPPTGGSSGLMAGVGAALLGLGGVLHLGSKRRRSNA